MQPTCALASYRLARMKTISTYVTRLNRWERNHGKARAALLVGFSARWCLKRVELYEMGPTNARIDLPALQLPQSR